jgi:hypothetical protein
MSFRIKLPIAAALVAPVLAWSVLASTGRAAPGDGILESLVEPRDGERACYSRTYDARHLAAHPRQKVTEMQFRLTYYVHEPDEYSPEGQRNYYFELRAKLRGMKQHEPYTAAGDCMPSEDSKAVFCGVDCDGGGVYVTRRDTQRILVDLEQMGRIRMSLDCGEDEDAIELTAGEDDKSFLLTRQPDAACPVYEDW